MTDDLTKVERLAGGGKTKIGGRWKSIDELTVKEASQIKSSGANANVRSDNDMDSARAKSIHRELSSALLKFEDVANDIIRYKSEGRPIEQRQRVKKYIEDVIVCLKKAHKNL